LLPELSPANGVLTPGDAGFLATDFSSGRGLESSMLRFRNDREIRNGNLAKAPERRPTGHFSVQAVYTIGGLDGARWLVTSEHFLNQRFRPRVVP
jgi:hypothetical protein